MKFIAQLQLRRNERRTTWLCKTGLVKANEIWMNLDNNFYPNDAMRFQN